MGICASSRSTTMLALWAACSSRARFGRFAVASVFSFSIHSRPSISATFFRFPICFAIGITFITSSRRQLFFIVATPRWFPCASSTLVFLRLQRNCCLAGFFACFAAYCFRSRRGCTSYCCYAHCRRAAHLMRKRIIIRRLHLKGQCSRAAR